MSETGNKKTVKIHEGDPNTTGHEWDGIMEFDNPMPRWWLWVFYATIIWGIGYTIAYPAWPMVSAATSGITGWSSRGQVEAEIAAVDEANAPINAQLEALELAAIPGHPELEGYAVSAGAAVFKTWCAQCHGSGAAGAKGYPNLLDDDWLWGGTMEDIHATVSYGIRNEESDDARYSAMPAFGRDELLQKEEVSQVVNYVMSLSDTPKDASEVAAGAVVFEENCASCHGADASGDIYQGAPNLKDAIWLYGGDYDTLYETVWNSRFGVMPNWDSRLSEAEIRAVSAYVHQLGGGE
ncbi:cytochrome-c oxidase, cbb3-type subunit III [Ruegeria sp. TM1040]|jgi:cytochrome c oxidase cbb3-type subunit 3|uniref:cytochrome-c oxidase, cbb3-type subunit III n=1 Tax=Rhodobacterales TaxID=204455 RepID=UPI0000462DF2|nr:cytochrome-c oxidase, cbb3-type subunit III [Ruegeria sp. TM1040]ABF65274.1 cytochrome c oxidase; cbb3-type; subunit III [Ruegeria sp. TM1040]